MQKHYGRVTNANGNAVPGARLTIHQANVRYPLPVIFSENADKTLGSQPNPLLTNSNGEYSFIVAPGRYEIKATGSSAVLNISNTITQYTQSAPEPIVKVTLNRDVYTESSTWTAPVGVIQAVVTCVGPGGGGGAGSSSVAISGGGAGGAGGATIRRTITVTPSTSYSVIIGAAGIGGSSPGIAGTDGGSTKFGALVEAFGGKGGGSSTGAGGGTPGLGGSGTLVGVGGGGTTPFTTTAMSIVNGHGAAISGSQGGSGGSGSTGASGGNGNTLETYAGGTGGLGDSMFDKGGGGGGGSSAFGAGGAGGTYGGAAAQSPGIAQYGAGGGGGAALAAGAAGSKGICIVEYIS